MPFPVEALIPWQRTMVESVADSFQVDPAMPALVSLGVLSAAVARKAVTVMPSGMTSPLHLWVLVVAGPGEAKSRTFGALARPLERVQEFMHTGGEAPQEQARPQPTAWERLDRDDEDADLYVEPERPNITVAEVAAILADRQQRHGQEPLELLTGDVTPTRLHELLASQASGLTLLSPEAGFEAWLTAGGPVALQEQATLNRIWDGETVRRRRASGTTTVTNPALTMIVGMQPHPFATLASNRRLRGVGYTLRFLLAVPESRRGMARAPFPPLPPSVVSTWEAFVLELMRLQRRADEGRASLQVSAEAGRLYDAFFNRLQERLRPGADLDSIHDYVERLRTNVPRIAGVLHLAQGAARHGEGIFMQPVGTHAMEAAITIAESIIPTALAHLGDGAAARAHGTTFLDAVLALIGTERWEGSATELLAAVNGRVRDADRADEWPGAPHVVSRRLDAARGELRARGVALRMGRTETGSRIALAPGEIET